jgi:hypothetical protein
MCIDPTCSMPNRGNYDLKQRVNGYAATYGKVIGMSASEIHNAMGKPDRRLEKTSQSEDDIVIWAVEFYSLNQPGICDFGGPNQMVLFRYKNDSVVGYCAPFSRKQLAEPDPADDTSRAWITHNSR